MTPDSTKAYRFEEDVIVSKWTEGSIKLTKLNGDDIIFVGKLVVAEILNAIDGHRTFDEILARVSAQYDKSHRAEIRSKGLELLGKLVQRELVRA